MVAFETSFFKLLRSVQTIRFFPRSSSWVPVLTEEDLELRLGLGGDPIFSLKMVFFDNIGEYLGGEKSMR